MNLLPHRHQPGHLSLQELPFQAAQPRGRVVARFGSLVEGEEVVAEIFVVEAAGEFDGCEVGGYFCGFGIDGGGVVWVVV